VFTCVWRVCSKSIVAAKFTHNEHQKLVGLYIYIEGLQYMINCVFFVLRTCCQVPKVTESLSLNFTCHGLGLCDECA